MLIKKGQPAPNFTVKDVLDKTIELHALKGSKVYISFLRNTKCPLCSLHVYKLSKVAEQLKAQGVKILVFYESDKKIFNTSPFFKETVFKDNLFQIISDPTRQVYTLFGTEISAAKSTFEVLKAAGRLEKVAEAAKLGIGGDSMEEGTHPDAIPADFLIDENMIVQLARYGNDAGDNIDIKMVEEFANGKL